MKKILFSLFLLFSALNVSIAHIHGMPGQAALKSASKNFDALPDEILLKIFSTLSVDDLVLAAGVNRHFDCIIATDILRPIIEECKIENDEIMLLSWNEIYNKYGISCGEDLKFTKIYRNIDILSLLKKLSKDTIYSGGCYTVEKLVSIAIMQEDKLMQRIETRYIEYDHDIRIAGLSLLKEAVKNGKSYDFAFKVAHGTVLKGNEFCWCQNAFARTIAYRLLGKLVEKGQYCEEAREILQKNDRIPFWWYERCGKLKLAHALMNRGYGYDFILNIMENAEEYDMRVFLIMMPNETIRMFTALKEECKNCGQIPALMNDFVQRLEESSDNENGTEESKSLVATLRAIAE